MRKKTFLLVSGFVLIAILVPYVIATWGGGDDYVFGGFLVNPLDGNSYLAKMRLGLDGDWSFRLPYTSNATESGYIFLFYIFLGHIARIINLDPLLIFHIARLTGSIFLLFSLRLFYSSVFEGQHKKGELAFILTGIGSGLGWFVALSGGFTSDLWVAEAYPFLSMFTNPHFPLGMGLILLFFSYLLRGKTINPYWIIIIGLLTAIIMPFNLVLAAVVGVIYSLLKITKKELFAVRAMVLYLSLGGPYLLYQYWISNTDPYLKLWNSQNLTPSPRPGDFMISFLPLLILAILGLYVCLKKQSRNDNLLLIWFIVGLILIYIPWGLQRRFMTGFFIPVAGLSVWGLDVFRNQILKKWITIIIILLIPLTNVVIISSSLLGVSSHSGKLFISRDEYNALKWVEAKTEADAIILASPEMGIFIPAQTGRRVLYGHPFETISASEMKQEVEDYYRNGTYSEKQDLLKIHNIDYVFYGPREIELGSLQIDDNLKQVYTAGNVIIYQVDMK